ncbi:uncharacterized protein FYW61_019403 [Anableps anableps]
MAALTQLLVGVLLSEAFLGLYSDQTNLTAKPGETVTLPCQAMSSERVTVLDWTKKDLGSYRVLLYRNSEFDTEQQHPSFTKRVDLKDKEMKDGDVSLVLKNVTTADSGTYECRVVQSGTTRPELGAAPNRIINLYVAPRSRIMIGRGNTAGSSGGNTAGSSGWMIGLTVLLLLIGTA